MNPRGSGAGPPHDRARRRQTSKTFVLDSTQQTWSVPLTEANIPNSSSPSSWLRKNRGIQREGFERSRQARLPPRLLRSRRSRTPRSAWMSTFRPTRKNTARRPRLKIEVAVKDAERKPDQAEVTLGAVDYGVLSLTAYKTPSLLESVWVEKALQVMNEDSRQRIISRRVITPKGADEGGGGGWVPELPSAVYRVLAFWLGSLPTTRRGSRPPRSRSPNPSRPTV